MSIILEKGKSLDITFSHMKVELGWCPNTSPEGYEYDLDVSAFLLTKGRRLANESNFVFYNNATSPDGSVMLSGDDLTGEEGETLDIHLDKTDEEIEEIVFAVSIYKAEERDQSFGKVTGAFISISEAGTCAEIARYNLSSDFSEETAVEFGRLVRTDGRWAFEAIGVGNIGGMQVLINRFLQNRGGANRACNVATLK